MADKNSKKKGEFSSCEKVVNVIKPMEEIERLRANDRSKVDGLANGQRPYSKDQEEKYQIQINVNFQEMPTIIRSAVGQVNAATLHTGNLFNASCLGGQVDKRDEWGAIFTKNIHKPLQEGKSGKKYAFLIKNRNLTMCVHGVGALLWQNPFRWMPRFIGMEDLLIPTETYCDFTNLRYFAVNLYLVPGELMEIMAGDKVKPGWNKKMIGQILDAMKELYSEGVPPTWRDQPEAMTNLFKENRGWYYSDAVPKIRTRWFFYQKVSDDPKEASKWYRCMILREAYGEAKPNSDFLFDGGDEPFADSIDEILNVQYGDSNYVAPLKYHSVRGIGIALYAPVEMLNRLRCEFVQSVFEHLKMYFRISDPADRDRLKQIVLTSYGVLPEGLNIVSRNDRHQIDPNLVQDAMGQLRGIMQESASSFVKDTDDGSDKQMTAKEATIRLNQANVMVSTMLQSIYLQENFLYEQVKNRFCEEGSADPDVQKFQKACIREGIPRELMVADNWRISVNRVLGGGDKTQAQQEGAWIWGIKNDLDPSVQNKAKRLVVATMLNDWSKAFELVPEAPVTSSSGSRTAEDIFGTLMTGNAVAPRVGIDQQGFAIKLLTMMQSVIQRIEKTGGVGTIDEIIGLQTVAQSVAQSIQILEADPKEKQLVKQLGDALGKNLNMVKAFLQRFMQSQQAKQQQGDPATDAKVKGTILMAQTKAAIAQQNAALKQRHKMADFQMQQQMDKIRLASEIERENLTAHHNAVNEAMQNAASIMQELRAMQLKEKASPEQT
jgi:hypothetical protein